MRSRSAFTMIELMVTVAIVGAIAALGFSSLPEAIARARTHQLAQQIYTDVLKCRASALTSATACGITFTARDPDAFDGGEGHGSYLVQDAVDSFGQPVGKLSPYALANGLAWQVRAEGDVDVDNVDATLLGWGAQVNNGELTYTITEWNDTIAFDAQGLAVAPAQYFGCDGAFHIFVGNKAAWLDRNVEEGFIIAIHRNGAVTLERSPLTVGDDLYNGWDVEEGASSFTC